MVFLAYLRQNAITQVTLRFVPFKYRMEAICFMDGVVRLTAALPSVAAFGALLDASCQVHQEECGRETGCVFYDQLKLSGSITGLSSINSTSDGRHRDHRGSLHAVSTGPVIDHQRWTGFGEK